MKRILSMVLSLALVAALAVPASATATGSMENFKEKQTYTEGQFTDVSEKDWYAAGVAKMYALGLMSGTSATTFSSAKNITAPEIYLLMARLENIYSGGSGELVGDDWQTQGKNYLDGKGLAIDLHANADGTVARAYVMGQLVALFPVSEFAAINTIDKLPDVDGDTPYSAEILMLYNAGVLTGTGASGAFAPDSPITRGELATLLVRVIDPTGRESFKLENFVASVQPYDGNGFNSEALKQTSEFKDEGIDGRPAWEHMPLVMAAIDKTNEHKFEAGMLYAQTLSTTYAPGTQLDLQVFLSGDRGLTVDEMRFTGVGLNEDDGIQYELINAVLTYSINQQDREAIMKILNEKADKINNGRNTDSGRTTDEAKAWKKAQLGKSYELNEVVFTWDSNDEGLKTFIIKLKK